MDSKIHGSGFILHKHNKGHKMDTSPIFLPKAISLDGARKLDKIRVHATSLLAAIETITPGNENGRMLALAMTKLEECVLWSTKAVSREPVLPTIVPGEDDL